LWIRVGAESDRPTRDTGQTTDRTGHSLDLELTHRHRLGGA